MCELNNWCIVTYHLQTVKEVTWLVIDHDVYLIYTSEVCTLCNYSQLTCHCIWKMLLGDWCYLTKTTVTKVHAYQNPAKLGVLVLSGLSLCPSIPQRCSKEKSKLAEPRVENWHSRSSSRWSSMVPDSAEGSNVLDLWGTFHLRNSKHLPFTT